MQSDARPEDRLIHPSLRRLTKGRLQLSAMAEDTTNHVELLHTTWKVSCNLLNLRKQFAEEFFRDIFVSH
jgi:hypothetical protein